MPKIKFDKIKNILIIRPDAIGDLVLTLPAIAAVKEKFPQAKITVLIQEYTAPIAKQCPAIDQIIYDYDLKKYNFDLSINYYNQWKDTSAAFKAQIPLRLGDSSRISTAWMNNLRVFRRWDNFSRHEVEHNFDLLQPLGIDLAAIDKKIVSLTKPAPESAEEILNPYGIRRSDMVIGIHLSTGKGNKPWLPQRFARLIEILSKSLDAKIILTGGKNDAQLSIMIQNLCTAPIINLAGKTSLSQLLCVLSRLNAYIGADTGPTHIAAAYGVPTVAIFSAKFVKPTEWGPWQTPNAIIHPQTTCKLTCRPQQCPYNYCGDEVNESDVFDAVSQLMQGKANQTLIASKNDWFKKSASILLISRQNDPLVSLLDKGNFTFHLIDKTPSFRGLLKMIIAKDINIIHNRMPASLVKLFFARFVSSLYLSIPPLLIHDQANTFNFEDALIGFYKKCLMEQPLL